MIDTDAAENHAHKMLKLRAAYFRSLPDEAFSNAHLVHSPGWAPRGKGKE